MKTKWLHVIGVSGVTTSIIALMYRELGWKVTGSDKGFWPPISQYLADNNFKVQVGYKAEHLIDQNNNYPDLVIYQGLKGEQNPEYQFALEHKIKLLSYPQAVKDEIIKSGNSIVVAGTYGKTTITAVLVKMFLAAGINISYMIPGLPIDQTKPFQNKTGDTKWSVVEGDEYLTSFADSSSKFFHYQATHLILTSVKHDHLDMFPTLQSYLQNFAKLIKQIPDSGLIVANANDPNVVELCSEAECPVIYYSSDKEQSQTKADWYLSRQSRPLPCFIRDQAGDKLEIIPFDRKILGSYNDENLLAASVMAYELGIRKEVIQTSITSFAGIKRRLEVKFQNDQLKIIDDFGSSPPKAQGSLKAILSDFPESEIYVIFEPNTGNRTDQSLPLYKNVFNGAHAIILPRFTKLGKTNEPRFDDTKLFAHLQKYYANVYNINDDQKLIDFLLDKIKNSSENNIIVFMGSHGFRGMISQLVESVKNGGR